MNFLRPVIEKCVRGLVLKRSICVQQKKVPLYVSPDAQLKYLKLGGQAFDQDLIRIAERFVHSDSIVWDVGANVGVFTFAAATLAQKGTVLAIEADIWLASLLRKTARLPSHQRAD
jgi:predicted RNA methylase